MPITEMDTPAKGSLDTYAIFGQGSYEIINNLTLTLGARFQKNRKRYGL